MEQRAPCLNRPPAWGKTSVVSCVYIVSFLMLCPASCCQSGLLHCVLPCCRLQLKCDGTLWCTGGEGKGNMVYPALLPLMRTPRLPVVEWTDAPRRFKWTRPFRRKTKCGFCACAITFQLASNSLLCVGHRRLTSVSISGQSHICALL